MSDERKRLAEHLRQVWHGPGWCGSPLEYSIDPQGWCRVADAAVALGASAHLAPAYHWLGAAAEGEQ